LSHLSALILIEPSPSLAIIAKLKGDKTKRRKPNELLQ
jgi:hypothetical protein